MKYPLIMAFFAALLVLGCVGDEKGPGKQNGGGTAGGGAARESGGTPVKIPAGPASSRVFPEVSYAKIKDAVSTGDNVLNDQLVTALIGVAPAAGRIVGKAIGALDRKTYFAQLDELAKKVGLADNQVILARFQALQRARMLVEMLSGFDKQIADGFGKMIPQMMYGQCKGWAKGSALTRADLDYAWKNMAKIKPVKKDLALISGSCMLLLRKK